MGHAIFWQNVKINIQMSFLTIESNVRVESSFFSNNRVSDRRRICVIFHRYWRIADIESIRREPQNFSCLSRRVPQNLNLFSRLRRLSPESRLSCLGASRFKPFEPRMPQKFSRFSRFSRHEGPKILFLHLPLNPFYGHKTWIWAPFSKKPELSDAVCGHHWSGGPGCEGWGSQWYRPEGCGPNCGSPKCSGLKGGGAKGGGPKGWDLNPEKVVGPKGNGEGPKDGGEKGGGPNGGGLKGGGPGGWRARRVGPNGRGQKGWGPNPRKVGARSLGGPKTESWKGGGFTGVRRRGVRQRRGPAEGGPVRWRGTRRRGLLRREIHNRQGVWRRRLRRRTGPSRKDLTSVLFVNTSVWVARVPKN